MSYDQTATEDFCIPTKYIQWGEQASYVDAQIPEGSTLRCYPAEIMSPSKFYVNLMENWFKLETFQQKLQGTMKASDEIYELQMPSKPRLELLAPGLFVICKYLGPRDKKMEWHRAMILENPAYSDAPGQVITKHHSMEQIMALTELNQIKITVKLVDYGTIYETEISSIRYMQKSMLRFPIQAIECQLNFRPPFAEYLDKQGHIWPTAACNRLDSFCSDRVLGVTFFRRTQVQCGAYQAEEISHGKWIVCVDVIEGRPNASTVNGITNRYPGLCLVEPIQPPPSSQSEPDVQAELERRAFVEKMDPSLVLHPDGSFSNLVPPELHDLSVHFLKWIKKPVVAEKEDEDSDY